MEIVLFVGFGRQDERQRWEEDDQLVLWGPPLLFPHSLCLGEWRRPLMSGQACCGWLGSAEIDKLDQVPITWQYPRVWQLRPCRRGLTCWPHVMRRWVQKQCTAPECEGGNSQLIPTHTNTHLCYSTIDHVVLIDMESHHLLRRWLVNNQRNDQFSDLYSKFQPSFTNNHLLIEFI